MQKSNTLPTHVIKAIKCGPIPVIRPIKDIVNNPITIGEKVIAFSHRYLVVPEGNLVGQPLELDIYQIAFILSVFDNPNETRTAICSIGRRNGKSFTIAVILLAFIVGPLAVQNSSLASAALAKEQAALVFKLMRKMLDLSPKLKGLYSIVPSSKRIVGLKKNVEFEALSAEAKTGHGRSNLVVLLDEAGQIRGPSNDYTEMLTTSQGSYDNPLFIIISTQAPNDADYLSQMIDDSVKSKDPHTVCHVYEAEKNCSILDKDQWKYANPGLGIFRNIKDVEIQAEKAMRMPSVENGFRNLILNQRVSTFSPFISKNVWDSCGGKVIDFGNTPVYAGLDLSARTDLTALVICGQINGVWHTIPYFWTPELGLTDRAKRDRQPYDVWVKQGYMATTPGATVDYEYIAQDISHIFSQLNVQQIAYDRWRIDILTKELNNLGVELPLIEFGQGFKDMSPAIDTLESELLNGRIAHGNHPVLTMCAANAMITKDTAGNRKLDKHKATGRIDGIVAMAMALGLAFRHESVDDDAEFNSFVKGPIIV